MNNSGSKSLFCRKCGTKLFADSLFCDKCGTEVIKRVEESDMYPASKTCDADCSKDTSTVSNRDQGAAPQRTCNVNILKERFEALKRMVTTLTDEKKKKIIRISIIVAIISSVVFLYALLINEAVVSSKNAELRNFATETMSEDYTNVYADVVSMEPEYFVYQYKTTSSGVTIGSGDLQEVVCKCKTVEGKTIWVTFFYQYYPEGNYSKSEYNYKAFTYSYDNPLRLYGRVNTARQVTAELEDKIGNVFVLDVKEKPKQ